MRNTKFFLYPIVSAILLSLPWLFQFPGWVLFAGFVPLLLLEDQLSEKRKTNRYLFQNYLFACFFIWNLLSAWWLGYATLIGLSLFLFLNTFLMTTIWYLYHLFKVHNGENLSLLFLVALWLSFEYLHLNWDMQLPGMILGGSFGNQVKIVQWYEFTGVLGGSLWVLTGNIIIYKLVKHFRYRKMVSVPVLVSGVIILILPVAWSFFKYFSYTEKGEKIKMVVLQPNIDPFTEKFGTIGFEEQLEILLSLVDSGAIDPGSLIIGPETAIAPFWENSPDSTTEIIKLRSKIEEIGQATFIIGANTKKIIPGNEKKSYTARQLNDSGKFYDEYNSAILIAPSAPTQIYHKNILVSGVEKVPFARYFDFLRNLFFDLGGTSGGLGQGIPINFRAKNSLQISPLICFESMFGEYLSGLIKKGGELVIVLTNDGWWKKSPGAELHFSYSRLRAIETRRSIARSANTGISGFINQRGDILKKTREWTRTAINAELQKNQTITFYTRYGDYTGRIAAFIASLLFLFYLSEWIKGKDKSLP